MFINYTKRLQSKAVSRSLKQKSKLFLFYFLFIIPFIQYGQDEIVINSTEIDSSNILNFNLQKNSSDIVSKIASKKEAPTNASQNVSELQEQKLGRHQIEWTDPVNVTVSQNNLTKTSATGWNAGAASINKIPANRDGFIEMTIGDPNTDVMFGLSYSNTDASWNTLDFNLYMSRFRGGNIVIFQRSTQITSNSQLGSYSRGDVVRVERVGSNVNFKKNGTIIYTLPVDRSRSMIADVALYDRNAKVLNAYCSEPASPKYPIVWTDAVNVSVDQNNLTKTSGTGWNAGAASTNRIPANRDGFIEMTIGDPNTDVMFGLSYSNTDASWNTLDFNLYMSRFRGGNIVIFQRSTQITSNSQLGSYSRGDVVRVERVGSNVNFKKNGTIIYTLPVDRSRSMIADVALYDRNAKVLNAYCSVPAPNRYPIEWTDPVNVSVSSNNLTKTSATGWNAGAASTNRIPANRDGYIEMTIGDPNTDVMFGLSYNNTNASWNTLDFNLYMSRFRGGNIVIFQRSTQITSNSQLGSYSRGDIVRVERVGSNVNFKKNGTVIYTLPADRSRSMIADVALYDRNAKVINAFCSAPAARMAEDADIAEENFDKNLQTEKKPENLFLSPNPTSTHTSLSFFSNEKTTADVIIYGTNKMMSQKNIDVSAGNNREVINLDTYPKGVYLLKIIFANGTQKTKKLIKTN